LYVPPTAQLTAPLQTRELVERNPLGIENAVHVEPKSELA
jgi:hypothetical protein